MKISYNWLKELIPGTPDPETLSSILTSVGLEVEGIEKFEELKGSLGGLLAGEIIQCEKHPQADKLKVTLVNTGEGNVLQIVCGATNAAVGQKVVVAPPGTIIYPINGQPVTIKKTSIRGIESEGMLCAEDEIGVGTSHEGIIILPDNVITGSSAAGWFKPLGDWTIEIGITPNRIDAMSHVGVARDVCAYLSHHTKTAVRLLSPFYKQFNADNNSFPVEVVIEDISACERYSGVSLAGIKVGPSPRWMQLKLKSIGVRPVNNIVDITNFILHQTGQPLHAYDLQTIKGNKIVVKHLLEGTPFLTLDGKERKLYAEDLMICNALDEPMCIAGVFGGQLSGVQAATTNIFLESAWFSPPVIRRTSLRHNLRTDAASRFEKGVDISQAAVILKEAAMMIKEIAGGEIVSEITDVYPYPKHQPVILLQDQYLKKLAGKVYNRDEVKAILLSLGFYIEKEYIEALAVVPPFNKPDVTLPADVAEEIMRIDGFDNISIPTSITIAPAVETNSVKTAYKENTANYLTGSGFSEIFTNSITNSKYYSDKTLAHTVKILNSLSSDLDIMRPSLMETGLESIVHNVNRKNTDLLFFEFGKTYKTTGIGNYAENEHLCLYISGYRNEHGWKQKPEKADFYFLKGICMNIFRLCRLDNVQYAIAGHDNFELCLTAAVDNTLIGRIGAISKSVRQKFDLKSPVFFADLRWEAILNITENALTYHEIPKFPIVHRDLSIVVNKNMDYAQIDNVIKNLNIEKLKNVSLFDVFESEKLGPGKKAFAITLTFIDAEKTLTDKETDTWMDMFITTLKNELNVEIRK